ncbi:MAG: hypothetical protein AAGA84_09155 [Pseudomonadota bacterium]
MPVKTGCLLRSVGLVFVLAMPSSFADETLPYGLFDFLGDMVEADGDWVDPMTMDEVDSQPLEVDVSVDPVTDEAAQTGEDDA